MSRHLPLQPQGNSLAGNMQPEPNDEETTKEIQTSCTSTNVEASKDSKEVRMVYMWGD
jgi:hypothetical protein